MPTKSVYKNSFVVIAVWLFTTLFLNTSYSQTITQTLTSSGSFVVPCGVTSLTVQCWGGGGGGGGGFTGNGDGGGGGGGGGYTVNSSVSVTTGSYNYTIGLGGTGGAAQTTGVNGGTTSIIFGTTTVSATGGNGGVGNTTGGATAGGTGGTGTFNGGNGGTGSGTNSGGGGEGASSTGNGVNATAQTAGTSASDGGDGAPGSTASTATGSAGIAPGGGGSGGTKNSAGGNGGNGQIIITYAIPPTANAGSDQLLCSTNSFAMSANLPSGFTGSWSCVTNCTGISFSNSTSATSNVNGVPANTSVTVRWTLTHTSGCTLTDDAVVTNSTSCPPLNDNCATATAFPSIPTDGTCANLNNQSTASASNSGVTPTGACTSNSGTPDDDVWFSFVATSTTHILSAAWVSGNTDVYWQVFSGSCSSTMTSLLCTDTDAGGTISGLTIGQTYYVRLYTWSSTGTTVQNICLSSPPPPPSNDNCSGATPFPTIPTDGTCANLNNQSTASASNSGVTPTGACTSNSGTPDDDVWFSFVATSTTHILSATWVSGNTDVYWQIFSGACGATMTSLLCTDTNAGGTVSGLTIGQTYYVRLYTWSSTGTTVQNICLSSPPPAPSNDNPCTATPAPVNAVYSCTTQTGGTLVGATSSTVGVGACSGTPDDDVWYSFVANNSTQLISLNNVAGSTTDLYHSVYSGNCGSIGAALVCSDPNNSTVTGLTVGNTYYVRVYSYTSTSGQTTTFSLCISPPPTPPVNDNPCTATPAPVNAVYSCTTQTGGTLVGATSSTVGVGACFGTPDDDVWYSFVANNSTQLISLNNVAGSTTDLYHSVYSGNCGSIGAALVCSDPNNSTVTGLTVGNTYYVRVYSYTSTSGQTTTFSLCISPPPTPPVNDNPCTATPAPVNAVYSCTTQTGGTLVGATSSTVGVGACSGTPDDDVWYSFVANNSTQLISLNNVAGSTTDLYHSVYSGNCGSIGAALVCSDPNNSTVTGLTVGNTYYVRVYSYTSTSGQTTTFSLCINPPALPPSNDDPCNATPVTVNSAAGTCTAQTFGTVMAATASGVSTGTCSGTADDDVWFSFVANNTSMNININNVSGSTTDLYHSVYSGSCGSPGTALICSDPNSSTINGLTVGNTYFIRIYSYTSTSGQTTTFSVCVNPTPPPPTNVTCPQMQPICSGSPIVFQAQSGGGSAASGPDYGCLSTFPNPTWFYMEIATPGYMAIDLTAGSDVDFAMWGPYANLAAAQAACSSYPAPVDCSYSTSNIELMDIASVNAGEVYAVLVTNYADVVQSITLNQSSGATATTNCAIVLPIGLLYFHAFPEEEKVNLEWETTSERNNDYFEIEKSIDAINWQTIGRKPGRGYSSSNTKYNHTDTEPFIGLSYYRLKQTDFDKSYRYSNIISVDLSKDFETIENVHPNPTNDFINFDVKTKSKGNITIELINYAGEIVYSEMKPVEFGLNSKKLDLTNLNKGVYLLKIKIEASGKTLIQKIIKN